LSILIIAIITCSDFHSIHFQYLHSSSTYILNYHLDMGGYPLLPRITFPTYRSLCTGDASIYSLLRFCFHSTTRSSAIPTSTLPDISIEYTLTILYSRFPSGTVCSFVSAPGLGSRAFVRSLRHTSYPDISDLKLL